MLALYLAVGDAVCLLHAVNFLLTLHEMAGVGHYLTSVRYGFASAPASDVLGVEAVTYRAQSAVVTRCNVQVVVACLLPPGRVPIPCC
jgi:hypothetical protein